MKEQTMKKTDYAFMYDLLTLSGNLALLCGR